MLISDPYWLSILCIAVCLCYAGSVAERSKALDLRSSLFGGVGLNPTAA